MAISSNRYDTTITIDKFNGFYQGSGGMNTGMGYAVSGKNFDTTDGVLKSMGGGTEHVAPALPAAIGTAMLLYRRFADTTAIMPGHKALFIVTAGTNIYARPLDGPYLPEMIPPVEWDLIHEGITNPIMDYVTYETSVYYVKNGVRVAPGTEGATEVEAPSPIDILIMTNADDGMLIVYGDTLDVVKYKIQPDPEKPEKKFGVLTRHAERIWGAAITDEPDMLMYSAPYNPLDWAQNNEYPEDGAGDIQQPSWDGDSFVALRNYGSQLIAIKKNRVWRVSGTNPAEYYWKEQFGGGTICENTVVVFNDYMYLLSYDGLMVYDGTSVQRYRQQAVQDVMDRVNWEYVDQAVACMRGPVYCLALPLDGAQQNNAVLEFNTQERFFNLRVGVFVSSFLEFENVLYYTDNRPSVSPENSGRIMRLDEEGTVLPMQYVTAYQDLGYRSMTKSGFEVYLAADKAITITIGIRTEKKYKEKTVTLVPNKTKRVRLNANGRMFRMELSVPASSDAWRLVGTVQINMEIDWD